MNPWGNYPFSISTRQLFRRIEALALSRQHHELQPGHLALAATTVPEFGAALLGPAAEEVGWEVAQSAEAALEHWSSSLPPRGIRVSLGRDLRQILDESTDLALSANGAQVGVDHLILTLLHYADFRQEYLASLSPEQWQAAEAGARERLQSRQTTLITYTPTLDLHSKDLTAAVRAGELPWPLRGREAELRQVFRVLLRRTKRNPLLVGPAGAGKTALAWALAASIQDGTSPFPYHRVVQLNIQHLVANTSYRGELEAKVTRILQELRDNPSAILFADEVHTLHTGRAEGNVADLAEYFKPALDEDLRMIGATLPEQLPLLFSDSALERRFEPIWIGPLPASTMHRVLDGAQVHLVRYYREVYGVEVEIPPETLEALLLTAAEYLPHRVDPDRSLTLLQDAVTAALIPEDGSGHLRRAEKVTVTPAHLAEVGLSLAGAARALAEVKSTGSLERLENLIGGPFQDLRAVRTRSRPEN